MSREREALREKLDKHIKSLPAEDRREVEKMMFDMLHSKKEADRLLREEKEKNQPEKDRLKEQVTQLSREVSTQKVRIEQLEQQVRSKEFQVAASATQVKEAEANLDYYRKPVIDLDKFDMLILDAVTEFGSVENRLKELNDDMRQNLRKIAHIRQDEKLFHYFESLSTTSLLVLTHLGYSELHFLRTMTGSVELTPISFIVNGVKHEAPPLPYSKR
jgi:uncharacterized protein (DUF3084 family)